MSSLAASDPLTLPTWLPAVFTGVLAVGAIVTAVFAILAFRKQSTEVRILQEQAQRESEQRLRSQASRVFVWQEFETDPVSQPSRHHGWPRRAERSRRALHLAPRLAAPDGP
jgi:hypothetical protein